MENNDNNNENTNVDEENQDLPREYDAAGDARNKIIFFVIVVVILIAVKIAIGGQ